MKKLLSLILILSMIASMFVLPVSALEPIAEVTNNGKTNNVYAIDDLCASILPDGTSKVKLVSDVERTVTTGTGQIVLPYTCEIDLNGHTWSNINSASGNAIKFANVGSQNSHAIVKNGTVLGASVCISSDKGSVEVRNCTLYSPNSIGVSIYVANEAFNSKNLIEDCTILAGGDNGVFSFQGANPMNGAKMTIRNSTLAHIDGSGYVLNNKAGGSCTVELGENVHLYAMNESVLVAPGITVTGLSRKAVAGSHTVSAAGYSHSGLMKWSTVEGSGETPSSGALATVTTNGSTVNVNTVEELVAAISPTGKSVITLLRDLEHTVPAGSSGQILISYPCTIDLNGYTWSNAQCTKGNAMSIAATSGGTENSHTVVKNGTIIGATMGIRHTYGSLEVQNCTVIAPTSVAIGLYGTATAVTARNLIEGCTLVAGGNGAYSWHADGVSQANMKMTIVDTTLVQTNPDISAVNTRNSGAYVAFGENVDIYSVGTAINSNVILNGFALLSESGTHSITVNGQTYSGLKKWISSNTPTVDPPSNAIATITTDGTTVNVNTVTELTAAVSRTGNSQVKLLKDITHGSAIIFPYVCTVDFNGHTVTTNLSTGNGMEFQQIGSANHTAVVKNGKLKHYELGIRLTKGSLRVENMVIDSMNGACIGVYDDTTTRHVTVVDSQLSSKNYGCFSFNKANTDLSNFIFIVKNSTLVSYKNQSGSYSAVISRNGSATLPGNIVFGEGVELYSYYNTFNSRPFSETVYTRVYGEPLTLASGTHSVTVNGQTFSGLRKWTTPTTATKSAVAAVTNGSETAYPTTLEEILTLVQPDGLTKIKMLADVERKITTTGESGQIILPYTCEIDLNGHTWSNVNSNSGNAMKFSNVGTQNYHAVVKNGTILAASVGVSSMFGSLEVRNCTIVSPKSIGVSLYSTATAFNSKNLIEGCTILAGGANGAFSFQGESPMDGVQMRIVNSTLAQVNGTGYTLNSKAGGAGIVELGEKVSLYAVNDSMLKHNAILLAGEVLTAQSGTHTVSAAGYSFSNLKKWSTPEFPSNVIATVTTGGNTVNVTSVSALQNAISATGNSVVKLVKNITYTASSIQLPYSCTLDFNGCTIRTNTASGNCIQVLHAGSENPVTTLKNGTMVYHTVGVRVDGGAIVVSNMNMHGLSGVAVGIYDTSAAYKALNRIENSTLIGTEWGVVSFNKTNTNFSSTGITVENSTLVSLKPEGSHVFVRQNGTTGGTVTLGEGVKLYSYRDTGYAQSSLPVEGIVLEKAADPATFTHEDLGLNHSGLTLWQSKTGVTGISILFTKPANGTIYVPSLAEPGSTVTVTAVPDEGYEFSHLLVNGQVVNGLTFTAPQSGTVNLSGVFEEPQRTVIATVTTGDISLDVTTLEDLIAAVDPSGLSVITLLSDVERVVIGSSGQIVLPYSCTVDLNGFTWSNVRSTSGNALKIDGIGSVNTHSVVKNGTVLGASVGVSCTEGSLEVRNCTIVSPASVGVSIYTTNPAYNEKNLIDGCTILAGGRGAFSYHLSTAAQPGIKMVIRNSTLAQVNGENCTLNALVGGGDLYLGSNVALYSLSEATLVHDSITLLGKSLTAQSGTHTVSAAGYTYSGLKKWSTPEGVTATFSQATIPNGALGWVAAYDAQQRMISMSTVESVCGVLSVDLPTEIAESAADIKLFILQNGALSPVQAPVDADSEVPAPEQPDADAPWKDISRRDAENFVTKLFGEEGATVALSLRCPKEWHFSTSPGDGLTISRFDSYSNELEFGKAVAGNDGSDANWTAVATRTLLLSNMLTHEFVEQNGSEYRVRLVYENASKTDCISITLPLTECGENIRNNLYLNSSLLTTATDPGMGTLSALQGEKLLLLGNSFIGSSEIGTHLNRMFADNSKGATATPVSVGYATVQTFASDSARMDTIRSGEYGAVFLCGLYSGSEVAYIETIRAACETGGAQLILLPAHNESRTAILQASKTYPDIPILDWKAEIDTFLAAGQDKWDFCINDAHLHSTPLAGYVGAHMIYRAIYEECPIASAGSVTEFEMWAILADYIETGVVQLIDPADIFPIL